MGLLTIHALQHIWFAKTPSHGNKVSAFEPAICEVLTFNIEQKEPILRGMQPNYKN